jgi:3-phosphoshikimate 1-carboxyvinyltransferase
VLRVPGDPSSAAFWAAAAAALPGSAVTIEGVSLNPTRLAFFHALQRSGARIAFEHDDEWQGEPVGRLQVAHEHLGHLDIGPLEVPALIDELPALAALAALGGSISVRGAGELRVKESDRITALVEGLRSLGADAEERPDGFDVRANGRLHGALVDARGDHRLAMALAVVALGAEGDTCIVGAAAAAVSYPEFFQTLDTLRA